MSMLEQYYRINQAAGIHIHIRTDGSAIIQLCTVVANGSQLHTDKKITDLSSIGQLKEHLAVKSVVAINLSGRGVLLKQIEKAEVIDQNVFNKILPNAKSEDFYI